MDWDKAFEELAVETAMANDKAKVGSEAAAARDFAKGVKAGWWDEDGNSLVSDEDEDDDEEE